MKEMSIMKTQKDLLDLSLDIFMNWIADPQAKISPFGPQLGEILKELDPKRFSEVFLEGNRLFMEDTKY